MILQQKDWEAAANACNELACEIINCGGVEHPEDVHAEICDVINAGIESMEEFLRAEGYTDEDLRQICSAGG